jgi:putative RecB family exonuclease
MAASRERIQLGKSGVKHAMPPRLSASAINRFELCPKQFLFADVLRERQQEEPSPILVQANAIHHALERFFGLPLNERDPENLARALRSVWPQHRKRGAFAHADEEAFYGLEAIAMLRSFAGAFALDAEPLAREQWLKGRTKSGIEIIGKLDRVDERPDGLSITDYKTGQRMLEPEDLRHEAAVAVYISLAEASYGRPVTRVRYLYLRQGADVVWELEREDVEALKRGIPTRIGEIRRATREGFVATPGEHCRFCPFALRCPERSRVSLDDLQVAEGLPF